MQKNAREKKPVRSEDWHPADVIAALWKRGISLRQLDQKHGLAPGYMTKALRTRMPRAQRLIAEALDVPPSRIWPSRYDRKGQPLGRGEYRPRVGNHTAAKDTRAAAPSAPQRGDHAHARELADAAA